MGVYFSFLIVVVVIDMVMSQCPATPGPVVVVGTSSATNAYQRCATITTVVIPSTVTFIGKK